MIELKQVTKSYAGRPVVRDLSLHCAGAEVTVLIGPSGCGKTTTLEMINGLVTPDSGEVWIGGRQLETQHALEMRRNMGYVIQRVGLFPHYTLYDNIALIPRLLKWDERRIRKRVGELLILVDLPAVRLQDYPAQLSGGQQQRVGFARALAADPQYLLMDEPFSALDPVTRGKLQEEFRAIQQHLKKTVVLVTHDMDEALLLGDRLVLLQKGQIQQVGRPLELLRQPATDFVRRFIGEGAGIRALRFSPLAGLLHLLPAASQDSEAYRNNGISQHLSLYDALDKLLQSADAALPVLDGQNRPVAEIRLEDVQRLIRNEG